MAAPLREVGLKLHPELLSILSVGLVRAEPVRVAASAAALREEVREVCDGLARRYEGKAPSEIPELAPARALYRAFGIDPTRIRPSSEALLRRVLRGKPFPEILNAVDLANLSCLRFLLPIGLYDAEKIHGPVTLRRGGAGESYPGIRKDDVHLEGRPVLADDHGPFGNPTSDSLRTSVTTGTRSLWMVIFATAPFPRASLEADVGAARLAMERHLGPPDTPVRTTGRILP